MGGLSLIILMTDVMGGLPMAVRQMLVAGRYRLLEPVGAGGMGRVWLARDQMLDRDVAIKEIVPPDWMSDAEKDRLHSRTLREARSAARLTHPHVVRVYDVVNAEGLSWIVMEYVASRSLYQVLTSKGPYSPAEAARIGLAVLDALNAAHRAGVLHRDVKPHNVLIASDGRVLLTDFGLATFVDDGVVTTPGLIVGSPQYVSPERARDGASTVESDLWSFGATLYATVEGQSPYARDSAMATLAALATEPPDQAVRAGPLGPILEGLLRYEPKTRLSAAETERRLRVVLDEEPATVPPRDRAVPGPDLDPSLESTTELGGDDNTLADLDTPNLTESDQRLLPVLVTRASAFAAPRRAPEPEPVSPAPSDPQLPDRIRLGASAPAPASSAPVSSDIVFAGAVSAGTDSAGADSEAAISAGSDISGDGDERPGEVDDSDGWWNPSADRDFAQRGYIEGTFTFTSTDSDAVLSPVGAHHAAGGAGHRNAGSPSPRRPRPNRRPAAAGEPATSQSFRRGNQATPHTIPAPRSPVSGPLGANHPPPRRWPPGRWSPSGWSPGRWSSSRWSPGRWSSSRGPNRGRPPRPRPANRFRTRLIIAALLAAILLGGSLLSLHLIIRENSAPQLVRPPSPSASTDTALPGPSTDPAQPGRSAAQALPGSSAGSPPTGSSSTSPTALASSATSPTTSASPSTSPAASSSAAPPTTSASSSATGFSPVVCDARPPARVPAAPKDDAARGVNGWQLQAGWSYFSDETGFHIPVPDGWTYQRLGTTYCFRDPRGTRVLSLDVGRRPATDPQQGCRAEDRRLRRSHRIRDYKLIAISPVTLLHRAADWDYRYRTTAGTLRRVTTRWFTSGGRTYALGWATPEAAWATELGKIQMVRGTFYTDTESSTTPGPT